ncbi:hypothetical protein ISS37_09530 [candidate division KSB1 bacterium]|nr:hypothetical protein [candidate division KSB1 bacterium]
MKKNAILNILIFAVLFIGCSHQQIILYNTGILVLSNKYEKVEISKKHQLFIKWKDNDRNYSTNALIQECKGGICRYVETPVTANIVEINNDFIRLRSHAWKKFNNLPENYRDPNNDVRIISNKKPTIIIPIANVEAIYLYNRKFTKDDLFKTPKFIFIGAGIGAAIFASITIENAIDEKENFGISDLKAGDILPTALTGALFGSIVYPIYKYFDISFGKGIGEKILLHSKFYPVNQLGSGYIIEVIN